MGRTVSVVDNGGIPFRVHLSSAGSGAATISALVPGSGPASYAEWGTVPYTRARIGLCPTEQSQSPSGGARAWWHGGNSLLLHTSDGAPGPLVYIGTSIRSFAPRPNDTIVAFVSPMGNSAVPYPYAIGRTHTYLVEEAACIDNATLVRVMASAPRALDPYEVLYGYDLTRSLRDEADQGEAPRKFDSERQRMRGTHRNRAALAMPMRVLVPRAMLTRSIPSE
jgi:hypothetical protein